MKAGRFSQPGEVITALGSMFSTKKFKKAIQEKSKAAGRACPRHHGHRGAGKSSLTDELCGASSRPGHAGRIASSVDPHAPQNRRRAAGRPHPHECHPWPNVFMRRWPRASRARNRGCVPERSPPAALAGFDLVMVEDIRPSARRRADWCLW